MGKDMKGKATLEMFLKSLDVIYGNIKRVEPNSSI